MNYLISNISNFHQELKGNEGSGWTTNSALQQQHFISEIDSCEGSSYFPLPKELRNAMTGLINIQNEGN